MISSIFDGQPLQGDQLHVVRNLQQASVWMLSKAPNDPLVLTITEKISTRAFSWLKVPAAHLLAFLGEVEVLHQVFPLRAVTRCTVPGPAPERVPRLQTDNDDVGWV